MSAVASASTDKCMQGTCRGSTEEEYVGFSFWRLAAKHLWGIGGQGPGEKCMLFVTILKVGHLSSCKCARRKRAKHIVASVLTVVSSRLSH